MLPSSKPESESKTYNILLLGETGVGKSTFINAFVNYISFETLSDALKADRITSLIPTRFTVLDDNFQPKDIIFGSDENEAWQPGASATQSARAYSFKIGNSTVRLIDTPGMGDTRGIKKDEENFEHLLDVIGELKEIHVVCLMLRPNDSRLTVLFEYCVRQLFSYLQRSFCENIVFLFTSSRSTLYRPGDTIIPLKQVLKDIATRPPKVTIPFSAKNVFCIDNEAFRFLIASKQGISFEREEAERYATSWNKSSDVCLSSSVRSMNLLKDFHRLIEYVTKIKPHQIQETVSINEARRLISVLREPLSNVTENIVKNLRVIRQYKEKLEDTQKAMTKLEEELYIPVVNLTVSSENPRTVCIHENCTKIEKVSELSLDRIIDENVDRSRQSEQDEGEKLKEKIKELKARKSVYLDEMNVIQSAMAKFAHFLSHNTITGFTDQYKNYLEFLIDQESKLGIVGDKLLIRRLKKLMKAYEEEKKKLEEDLRKDRQANADVTSVVTAGQIIDVVQTLYALKLSGSKIHDIYSKVRSTREREILTSTEKEYKAPRNISTKFIRFFQPPGT